MFNRPERLLTPSRRWSQLSRRAKAAYTSLGVLVTFVSVAGLVPSGARWYERVYRDHSQVGFVVTSVLVLLFLVACVTLSLCLLGRHRSHGSVMLLETGPPPEFISRLRFATQIDMIATTGLRFLQIHKQALVEVLRNNGHIRVLLAKPRSQFLRDVRDMESSPSRRRADLGGEIEMAHHTLQETRDA